MVKQEQPTGKPDESQSSNPVGHDTSGKDGFSAKKNQAQREGYQSANLHSHPLNPANRGDVVTPEPQPDTRPKFSAYANKSKPIPKTSADPDANNE